MYVPCPKHFTLSHLILKTSLWGKSLIPYYIQGNWITGPGSFPSLCPHPWPYKLFPVSEWSMLPCPFSLSSAMWLDLANRLFIAISEQNLHIGTFYSYASTINMKISCSSQSANPKQIENMESRPEPKCQKVGQPTRCSNWSTAVQPSSADSCVVT